MNFMPERFGFLDRLAANNNRPWFQANKAEYERLRALWMAELQTMISLMAEGEPSLRYAGADTCAYRIYRDTRFSPDKTPYKTYFSALISPTGQRRYGRRQHIHTLVRADVPCRYRLQQFQSSSPGACRRHQQLRHLPADEGQVPGARITLILPFPPA